MSYLINKESLDIVKDNYNDYKYNELFNIKEILEEIVIYCSRNRLLIYGGYALSKNINIKKNIVGSNVKNNNVKVITSEILEYEDIDVYSSNPADDLNGLLKTMLKKTFVKSVVYKRAKHEGTYTLFVNQIKVMDMTFIDLTILSNMNYNEIIEYIKNKKYIIRVVVPFITFVDLLSVLESNDSLFRIEKTQIKLFNLQTSFPIKNNNFSFNELKTINFDFDNFINKLISIKDSLKSEFIKPQNINEYRSIKRADLYKQAFKFVDVKYDFVISGLYAYYLLANKSKSNIPFDKLFELDIYITDEIFFLKIKEYFDEENISYLIETKKGWSNFSQNYFSLILDNDFIINLYILDKEKYYLKYDNIKISSLLFLKSHLLLKSNIYNKNNNKVYNKCLYDLNLLNIKYKFDGIIGLTVSEQDIQKNYNSIKPFDVNKDDDKKDDDKKDDDNINL